MDHIEEYFCKATYKDTKGNSVPFEKGRVLDFLKTNRNCTKGMLMRWAYSEGSQSRSQTLLENIKEHYLSNLTEVEYLTLKAFSKQYDDFLEYLFPKLKQQKEYIKQVLLIRLESGSNLKGMNLRTLDGCSLSWDIIPTGTITKGYWNPISNKSLAVKIHVPVDSEETIDNVKSEYVRGLFTNIVHSIDAAVMRIIIYRMHKRTAYTVNQLHDCVLTHPNYVSSLYQVIEEIYTDGTLDHLADKVFFTPMQDNLNDDSKNKIKPIRNEFYKNADAFKITKGSFIAQNAYVPERSFNSHELYTLMSNLDKFE